MYSSIQNGEDTCYVWDICNYFGAIGLYCPSCYFANSKRTQFFQSLPWGGASPIENTELNGLTNLKYLTIELCDWDFQIGVETFALIKEFLRNSPKLDTLILRIRLKVISYVPGVLPQAITAANPARVLLVNTIVTDIATLRSTEILENNESKKAGVELQLTFDINPPAPPIAATQ
jgi:hypothetical protein